MYKMCMKIFSNLVKYSGRPKDEEPHIKRSVKKKKEIVEYIVRVNLKELGIDEANFDELQELFKMFDNDKDGVLSLKEFEKILSVLGRSGGMSDVVTDEHYLLSSASITTKHKCEDAMIAKNVLASEDNAKRIAGSISADQTEHSVCFNEYLQLMGSQHREQEPTAAALLECFQIFDTDKDGRISEAEL